MGNAWSDGNVGVDWTVVGRQYVEMMEEVTPYLAPAEQIVYQPLFFLSYAQGQSYAVCRYEELCGQCGLSLRTLQRALQGLRTKKLVKTRSHSHTATIFAIQLLSQLPHRPAFLPRQRRHTL